MIRARARRGVGCASTGRARRPWVMMAEGAGGRMRVGGEDGADELMQLERYRWRARAGWSIAWDEWRGLALSNTMGRSPSGCGHASPRAKRRDQVLSPES
eukprot:CAMPEP_0119533404 /NCGR_PEP_ID=MMETSP1344-20130328/46810_1 /TAXON_ID=236787 /ORGANISM="Florenciella parvula, Strain CCMP2471" /LENGTH=99 /DNA_ID=CAMNT_0007574279 /DNA_START=325 /DNA_END=625 /DNA_ORIENTATION=+